MNWSGRCAIAVAGASVGVAMMAMPAHSAPLQGGMSAELWEPLQPVEKLDVERYVGDWYQLAAVPQPFNLMCAKDTQARYEVIDASNVSVRNTCTTWAGDQSGIAGNARVTDTQSSAQLHVSFPGVPFQDGLDGPPNYVVTYIADDYSWALVGDPLRTSGFVLSRSPAVDGAGWSEIRRVAESRGYNACTIVTSPTTEGKKEIQPLCTI